MGLRLVVGGVGWLLSADCFFTVLYSFKTLELIFFLAPSAYLLTL